MLTPPYPEIDDLLHMMGEAGRRLADIEASEGAAGNVAALRRCRIVIWAKHGVMARSDVTVKRAADRVEYAATAAKYEYLNLQVGEMGEGLSPDEIRAICTTFAVRQEIF